MKLLARLQSIVCLFRVSFGQKMGWEVGVVVFWEETKKFRPFVKNIQIASLPVGEEAIILLFMCIFICVICISCVFVLICICLGINTYKFTNN